MDFHRSAEIRWFLAGAERWPALLDWFAGRGDVAIVRDGDAGPTGAPFVRQEAERVDAYLRIPECASVGLKRRQGRLEAKALVAGPRPYARGPARGRVDEWVKWSLGPTGNPPEGPWSEVAKRRLLRKYAFASGCSTLVSPDDRPRAGCNVEIARLTVEGERWTTLGFEAFGAPAAVAAILDDALVRFFERHGPPPVELDGRASLSYPAWLALAAPRA